MAENIGGMSLKHLLITVALMFGVVIIVGQMAKNNILGMASLAGRTAVGGASGLTQGVNP